MHTAEHLRQLFIYNEWANLRVLSAVRDTDDRRAKEMLAHLLTTEQEYYERLSGKDSTGFDFWPEIPLVRCEVLLRSVTRRYRGLLELGGEAVLDRTATYKTSEGVEHTNTYREMLTHVLIHSAIHRGNIMVRLREAGVKPPLIDYIIYLRETGTKS
jgi:uncharacterized damage-inducible protein DinB